MKCGCYIEEYSDTHPVIAKCPLCEAVPILLGALVQLVDYLAFMCVPEDCEDKYSEAEQAIKEATQ